MTVLMHELTDYQRGMGVSVPAKVLDIELSEPLADVDGLDRYRCVLALVRFYGAPIGYVTLPVRSGRCEAEDAGRTIVEQLSEALLRQMVRRRLEHPLPESGIGIDELFAASDSGSRGASGSLVSVVVCTRDRPGPLAACLESIGRLHYSPLEVIVVDNASQAKDTEALVRGRFPGYRYVLEPRPGVNWARNTGIEAAGGEIVAFTDDDVLVDPHWLSALVSTFSADPQVSAVTGLVVPAELETEPQMLVEKFEGFARRFSSSWYRGRIDMSDRYVGHVHATRLGVGCNMAVRKEVFRRIGGFDPALDCGIGDDIDFLFRMVEEGHTLVNEPAAVVRHFHRRTDEQLREQMARAGTGFVSLLTKAFLSSPRLRPTLLRTLLRWWAQRIGDLLRSGISPGRVPSSLVRAHLWHSFSGVSSYFRARRRADALGPLTGAAGPARTTQPAATDRRTGRVGGTDLPVAVRAVDLTGPVAGFDDVAGYGATRVSVLLGSRLLGDVEIHNSRTPISAKELLDAISQRLDTRLLACSAAYDADVVKAEVQSAFRRRYAPGNRERASAAEAPGAFVSVVVPTYDRPDQLRRCLRGLINQDLDGGYEIVVVDNHPDSGLARAVVDDFAGVRLISCERPGAAAARNAGFRASRGRIIAMTDDDVIVPPGWLRNLTAAFAARADVAAVFGRVLPYELETRAQRAFERYRTPLKGHGGPASGLDRIEAGARWFTGVSFEPPPVWILGMTANAAIRRDILEDPLIGFLNEALGPGTFSGAGEDPYLTYRILKEGRTVIYDPEVYVLHEHRESMSGLHRQVYNYGKSLYAFLLTAVVRDGELRAIPFLLVTVPRIQLWRLLRPQNYPKSLIVAEILGNLTGPFGLMRSRRRLRKQSPRRVQEPGAEARLSED